LAQAFSASVDLLEIFRIDSVCVELHHGKSGQKDE